MGTGYFMLVLVLATREGPAIETVPVPFNSRAECEQQGKSYVDQVHLPDFLVRYACIQAKR